MGNGATFRRFTLFRKKLGKNTLVFKRYAKTNKTINKIQNTKPTKQNTKPQNQQNKIQNHKTTKPTKQNTKVFWCVLPNFLKKYNIKLNDLFYFIFLDTIYRYNS
jgi:hypothetical protein